MTSGRTGAVAACVAWLTTSAMALNVYYIGNSHTDEAIGVMDIAIGFGVENSVVGRCMVPGCPLWLLYRDRAQKSGLLWYDGTVSWASSSEKLPDVLANHDWDAVVLQVFPNNGDNFEKTSPAALGFAEMIYDRNPECQILIMTSHAYAHSDDAEWARHMGYVSTIYEPLAELISTTWPENKPVKVIPILQVLDAVRTEIAAGTSPFLGTFESFYQQDGADAHLDPKGLYCHALTNYATIYAADPTGAVTTGISYWQYENGYSVDHQVASYVQGLVWDMVLDYPAAGVDSPTSASYPSVGRTVTPGRCAMRVDLLGRIIRQAGNGYEAVSKGVTVRNDGMKLLVRFGH